MCLYCTDPSVQISRSHPLTAYKIFKLRNGKLYPWLYENENEKYNPIKIYETNKWLTDWKTSQYWHERYPKGFHAYENKKYAEQCCRSDNIELGLEPIYIYVVKKVLLAGTITSGSTGYALKQKGYCGNKMKILEDKP